MDEKQRTRGLRRYRWALVPAIILLIGYLLPEQLHIPVEDAQAHDWNHDTFWYAPWGRSGVHKGIDIFAPAGQSVRAATGGIVIYRGSFGIGGRVVVILGPRWRVHYYAHLAEFAPDAGIFVGGGDTLGTVGTSGNAAGKAPHLHYSILTLIPYPWRWDASPQGWKKMFYLDPSIRLLSIGARAKAPTGHAG